MAQYTAYAMYTICFIHQTEYAAAVALAGGNGYQHCPVTAANTFGIVYPGIGGPITTNGIYFTPPLVPGSEIGHPKPSGIILDDTVDSMLIPGQTGIPLNMWPKGPDMNLVWWGNIILITTEIVEGVPQTTPIPPRRWVMGFDISGALAEGGSRDRTGSRIASRTTDGKGMQIRGTDTDSAQLIALNKFIPGYTSRSSWERFYIRVNTLGTNNCSVWRCHQTVSSNAGAILRIKSTDGSILLSTVTAGGVETLRVTGSILTLNQWHLIDVLLAYPDAAPTSGRVRVYINHVLDIDYSDATGDGIDLVGFHGSSELGQFDGNEAQWSIDLDDWINADIPNNAGVESLNSIDWVLGSHVRDVHVNSGTLTNYVGSIEMANQGFNPDVALNSAMTSATALATIEGLTDVSEEQVYPGLTLGSVAAFFGVYSLSAALVTSRIGYKIAGGATQWTSASFETIVRRWFGGLYRPSGLTLPSPIAPYSVAKEKSNDANLNTVYALGGSVEYIGIWGLEDDPTFPFDLSNNYTYFHNARYANTEWGYGPYGGPTAPCFAVGGTYVGNATAQNINLPAPAHFLWIRALTGGSLGVKCFGASIGAHYGTFERFPPNMTTRIWVDSLGQTKFSVVGSDAENNANLVTYQYIAFCDPGMRFNLCGVYSLPPALTNVNIPLFVTDFLAEFGFIQKDVIASVTNTVELTTKGVGNAGNTGQLVNGTPKADWGAFAPGILNIKANNINSTLNQHNFSLWRTTDPDCLNVMVQITSYVGDGNALRVISLPLTTSRYPLFVMIVPSGGAAVGYFRDPSHTGNNSAQITTLINSATAIMGAGIDQLFIGLTLNALGVTYEVFCIMGDEIGWNNGEFYPPNCQAKGDWKLLPSVPPGPSPGGLLFNGATGILIVKNLSGIYTLVPNKRDDTIYTGNADDTINVEIPDPMFKTGYIGG